jgi:glycosyltransferase involved in cell wall biosynthesis
MVVNEALACDIPVIVSKYAGCAGDLIEDGINGYIFDPLDSDSFRATMKNCLARKDLLPGFVKRSRERLDSYYNYNVASKIICEINHLPTATVINKNLKQAACVKKNIYF